MENETNNSQAVASSYGSIHQHSEEKDGSVRHSSVSNIHVDKQSDQHNIVAKEQPKPEVSRMNIQESARQPHFWRHLKTFLVTLAACLGSVALGTTIGYTSPAIPDLNSGNSPFHLNEMEISVVASIIAIGGLFGALIGGFLLDRYGRKLTVVLTTAPFAIGWAIIAASPNVYSMCVGRFLTGVCAGVMDVGVPVYISEIATPSVRGFMGSCYELGTNFGLLYVFVFGCFLRWNWLAIACLCVPGVQIFCLLLVPESPRWLLLKGRRQEGLDGLQWLHGDSEDLRAELSEIEEHIRVSKGERVRWDDLRQPAFYKPLGVIVGILLFQQLSGYGAIPEYLVGIFASAGSTLDPYVQTAAFGAVGFVSNFVSAFLVDRAGRRLMLFVSSSIMFLSLSGLASFFTVLSFASNYTSATLVWLPTISLNAYNFGVALGYGPIPFYMASEIFPLRFRGLGSGVAISSVWLFVFVTSLAFPHLLTAMTDEGVYWMLAAFSVLSLVYAFFVVPETRGKTLEELEEKYKS